MKRLKFLKTAVFASLCALSFNSATAAEAFDSDANLQLLDSYSTIPVTDLLNFTEYYQVLGAFYAPAYEQRFVNNLLITGETYKPFNKTSPYSGQPLPNSFFPAFFIHDTTTGKLVLTDSMNFNFDPPPNLLNPANPLKADALGILSLAISPVIANPYIAVSAFTPIVGVPYPSPTPLFPPFYYTLYVYKYDATGHLTNRQPIDSVKWTDINPNIDYSIITYNAAVSYSHDGKYLFATYTLNNGGAREQIFAGLAVNANGTINRTPVFEYVLPFPNPEANPPPNSYSLFFPEPDVKSFIPNRSTHYKLISGFVGFQAGSETGGAVPDGLLMSFDFDPVAKVLTVTGSQETPGYPEGVDLHPNQKRVIVGCTGSSSTGIAVSQFPPAPFSLNIPEPNKSLRLYSYDSNATSNALQYVSGHDFGTAWVFNTRWSNSGDFLALTMATSPSQIDNFPDLYMLPNPTPPPALLPTPGPGVTLAPCVISTLSYDRHKDTFKVADIQPVAPINANLAWSPDDSMIGTSGAPTAGFPGNYTASGQKDLLLYQVYSN